jgi:hypothetical protein
MRNSEFDYYSKTFHHYGYKNNTGWGKAMLVFKRYQIRNWPDVVKVHVISASTLDSIDCMEKYWWLCPSN